MLSPAQIDHYHTFGYVILRQCFSQDEVSCLRSELQSQMRREYPDLPASDQRRDWCCMLGEHNPTFRGLLEDPRFLEVAEQLHGLSLPVWCDGNRYAVSDTGWHADLYPNVPDALEHAGIKFIHYLEPLAADSGALRVIPGSHLRPFHERIAGHLGTHLPVQDQLPAQALATQPGDVVAFHQALYHAAFAVRFPRWMHTLAYFPVQVAPGVQASLQKALAVQMAGMRASGVWTGAVVPDDWLAEAMHNPRRRLLVERMVTGGLLGSQEANVTLAEQVLRTSSTVAV